MKYGCILQHILSSNIVVLGFLFELPWAFCSLAQNYFLSAQAYAYLIPSIIYLPKHELVFFFLFIIAYFFDICIIPHSSERYMLL